MLETLIARRPIFNDARKLVGYELLTRGVGEAGGEGELSALMLARALGDVGWEPVVGAHVAWVDASHELAREPEALAELPRPAVLRVPGSARVDGAALAALDRLRGDGYKVALQDFSWDAAGEDLLGRADYAEIDVHQDGEALRACVERLAPHAVASVAKNVDSRRDEAAAIEVGFDFLSGHFFVEPERKARSDELAPSRLAVLQLLAALQDPDVPIDEVRTLIGRDVSLTYRLLRYINSPYFGLRREVGSIQQAVVLLGLDNVKRWLTIIVLSGVETDPAELIAVALVRARFCELAGPLAGLKDTGPLFTMGLLSVLDALMDAPMERVLTGLRLPDYLHEALTQRAGLHGALLESAIFCERGEPQIVLPLRLSRPAAAQAYLEAQTWATETAATLAAD